MSKLLLIEPDKLLAKNIQKFLTRRGHKVLWRTSAQNGIDGADEYAPDAVIMDLQLGGYSGVEFLHEFRSYADWQEVPVIVFSSVHPDAIGGEEAAKAGLTVAAYVHKPTDSLDKLATTVEKALLSQKA